ncbi:MAG TPA: response regulator [Pyrinomonadaceae bacterium]|jgi:CheY-like chemotaxis protein|nr:response regulator [Pyrinomonadaceae bacterium]
MRSSSLRRILYVDDDKDACLLMGLLIQQYNEDYGVIAVGTVQKALDLMSDLSFDLYILDYRMPEMSGIELCRLIRQTDSDTPIMIYSSLAREADREDALNAGATAYLVKPNDFDNFNETIEELMSKKYRSDH